ncbi:hypothetical protein AVEN_97738-1 [Araneus ventricosus]|uniref:Uncharacterized protein n=1 Tax=Araneus ventricosus TaxID=182803 RepID=A0A4Y2E4T9_ARAVE|nr:hypothetical protein AVEN_97738-1 [Araneus ventricosus]
MGTTRIRMLVLRATTPTREARSRSLIRWLLALEIGGPHPVGPQRLQVLVTCKACAKRESILDLLIRRDFLTITFSNLEGMLKILVFIIWE